MENSTPQENVAPPKTLLVVEDEERMCHLLEKSFSRHGYRVLSAGDGQKAVDIYRSQNQNIDVVLLDFRLPKISGELVFRLMKAENDEVKVVITGGFIDPELKDSLAKEGVQCFVAKPYSINELRETIAKVVSD